MWNIVQLFLGGIEQPKIQSVIGLFRRESAATSDTLGSHDIDESEEYAAMRFDKHSPPSTEGKILEKLIKVHLVKW